MKKIFILPILIAPIVAHATDPVGPAVASGTPVVATASAPYATATAENGDTTNVVSASYVKGAYNDAIAAVNKVNADKQNKLVDMDNHDIRTKVISGSYVADDAADYIIYDDDVYESFYDNLSRDISDNESGTALDNTLITAGATMKLLNAVGTTIMEEVNSTGTRVNDLSDKRVSAVTTWGSNTTTKVPLVNNN